ncbi:MAG: response regulator transcription factor [Pseudomonadota bacterium]
MGNAIRVLLVDDHLIARGGVRLLLGASDDIAVVAEASCMPDALAQLACCQVDLVITDINMPGGGGLELLRTLSRTRPELPVIILSGYAESAYAIRALKLGAVAYLTKDVEASVLATAVRKAAAGGRYYTPQFAELMMRRLQGARVDLHEELSEREFDVMKSLAEGEALTAIGERLFLSPKTVSTYRTRVLEKLGMVCNAQLTRYAIEEGLI